MGKEWERNLQDRCLDVMMRCTKSVVLLRMQKEKCGFMKEDWVCHVEVQELKEDVDFPGDDILQIYSPDVQHCQLACTQHSSCLFFTFLRSDWNKDNRAFYCYLKHTATGSPSKVAELKGVTSGFKLMHQGNKTNTCLSSTYQDVDFTGSDYVQLNLNTSDECQKQCTSDPDCTFFSFTTTTFPQPESR
ncbi:uncharacterized protein LOC113661525 isoform X1 [Tachysurus ichikawai]